MIKVVHIGTTDFSGGASRAMYRLHQGLLQQQINSQVYCLHKQSGDKDVVQFNPSRTVWSRSKRSLRQRKLSNKMKPWQDRPQGGELFLQDRTIYREELMQQLPEADLYHLHWISRFVDIPTFFEQVTKPVVWTFHDMNPFTGGCHYDEGCGKFASGCGACPQLGSSDVNDLSKEVFERKKTALANISSERFRGVGDSIWIADEARKSGIFQDKKIDTIHYGLVHGLFKPMDKQSIRTLLDIPAEHPVLLFGAPGVKNRRKGFRELMEALEIVRKKIPDLFLLTFGGGELPDDFGTDHLHLAHISNDRYLAMVYNAADLFVIPSLQEAFGQTCLEAMACGVPCAGFDTGGIPDMIKPGETGFLAETGNPASLAEAIVNTLEQKEELGKNARKMVEARFTLKHQAEIYINIYHELLKY